jgi:hypothetical protein
MRSQSKAFLAQLSRDDQRVLHATLATDVNSGYAAWLACLVECTKSVPSSTATMYLRII